MYAKSQVDIPIFATPARWAVRVLTWLAFGIAAYLAWHAVTGNSVAACGVGDANSCDIVLSSSWAKWLGIPVAVAGLACYASLAGLSVLLEMHHAAARWINTAFLMLSTVAAVASLWFIAIQLLVIKKFCPYCLVTDICGIAIGAIALWSIGSWMHSTRHVRRIQHSATGILALKSALPVGAGTRTAPAAISNNLTAPSLPIALCGALVIVVLLVVGQLLFRAPTYSLQAAALEQSIQLAGSKQPPTIDAAQQSSAQTYVANRIESKPDSKSSSTNDSSDSSSNNEAPPPSISDETPRERIVEFLGGKLKLDVYKHPLLGSPEAPHFMVELFSYDCPHCRKMHRQIETGRARYGNQLAIIVLPIPMQQECNRLITDPAASHQGACTTARLAVGIAAVRPGQFAKFHDWMMADEEKPPSIEKILPKAYGLVDRDRLRPLTRSEEVNKQLAGYVDLYAQLRNLPSSNQKFGLPVQILGDHVMSGMAEKEGDVWKAWEQHLGVTSP